MSQTGLDVQQQQFAELLRLGHGAARWERDAVHAAQVGQKRLASALPQSVIEQFDVLIAVWFAVVDASVPHEAGQVRVAGFRLAAQADPGFVRRPQVGSGFTNILVQERRSHGAQPAIGVPHSHGPAFVLEVGAGDLVAGEVAQHQRHVARLDIQVTAQMVGQVGVLFGVLVEQQPQWRLGSLRSVAAHQSVVENPFPPIEKRLLAAQRRRHPLILGCRLWQVVVLQGEQVDVEVGAVHRESGGLARVG